MGARSLMLLVAIAGVAVLAAAALFNAGDPADPSVSAAATTTIVAATTPPSTVAADEPATTTEAEATTTSTEPSTTQAVPSTTTLPEGVAVCDLYGGEVRNVGIVESEEIVEVSGAAASRISPGVVWVHNDSGGSPTAYAVGPEGRDLGSFPIPGATAFDWEDMAAGPGPGGESTYLYFGDIGDNFGIRDGRITVFRVPEVDPTTADRVLSSMVAIPFEYPDGSHNAEALFVDPVDGSLYVVTKDDQEALVFRGNGLADGSKVEALELVTVLELGAEVTGADISWDGSTIAFRGYDTVWMWHRPSAATIAEALDAEPCTAPSADESQGEAIAFMGDDAYSTISEGANPPVHRVDREG
jgi:hypothetical protein